MLTDKGDQKGLFRGAIMQSGGPIPVGDIENGQVYYDSMVKHTRCGNATDTLDCLRHTPYTTFKHAMDQSPDFMSYSVWTQITLPRTFV
jgi:acetylcholinesterase